MLDSTLWEEHPDVRLTFIALVLLKDMDHVVRLPMRVIAKKVNLCDGKEENFKRVEKSMKVLESPDKKSLESQKYDGRRIRVVEDGWLILNGEKYDEEMRLLWARVKKTQKQRERREQVRKANASNWPTNSERVGVNPHEFQAKHGFDKTPEELGGE
jgi:hypothetical protein